MNLTAAATVHVTRGKGYSWDLNPGCPMVLLAQGQTDFSWKGLDCKYFGFRRLYGLCRRYFTDVA